MRELTMDELEQVSGAGFGEAAMAWGTAIAIGNATYGSSWGAVAVLTAAGISPLAALGMVGLALYGGYQLLQD